ncbi:tetratricopeptide repeat protein [Janthinobacterium fluminis]|uniref:Tetratricopeptide repeat protein n=1 Tax=Janthinobacterium fluminis TaxID=2987524 RepID=A0ABT5JVG8_9BURK|nr:tetratricopeptide repeat protein [Janthinobacterium fluminis]MDC8756740.1 tetratricopeptide repeat protein [Janthinobacterium fluminis]
MMSRAGTAARVALGSVVCCFLFACQNGVNDTRPRDQALPPFTPPNVPAFTCVAEVGQAPPADAQAEAWFREALALEQSAMLPDSAEFKQMLDLLQRAAERKHGGAMLKLGSVYLGGRAWGRNKTDTLRLLDEAMRLGVPRAYYTMGKLYVEGVGVRTSAAKGYALWQKAAALGNPQAMTELAKVLSTKSNTRIGDGLMNIPVAIQMLECAMGQGYGNAALPLHRIYEAPRAANGTRLGVSTQEAKARAFKILHEGVKLGCGECAQDLRLRFWIDQSPASATVSKLRSLRYRLFEWELEYDPTLRFPYLDKVLPLPPADLPPWDGNSRTILGAAMGVVLPAPPQAQPAAIE